jgi:hypothetical protein
VGSSTEHEGGDARFDQVLKFHCLLSGN